MTVETPAGIEIGRADLADVADIAPLFDAYRAGYGKPSDTTGAAAFLRERLAGGESVVLVAREAGGLRRAAGFTQLYPTFTSLGMARYWLLNDLFVAPGFRRRGVARALMERAVEFVRSTGAPGVYLTTKRDNAAARALYEALGFSAVEDFVDYDLRLG